MRVHFTIKRNRDKEGNDTLSGFGKFSSFRGKRLANAWFKKGVSKGMAIIHRNIYKFE